MTDEREMRERVRQVYVDRYSDDTHEEMWSGEDMINFGVEVAAAERDAERERRWNLAEGNPPPPVGDCRKLVWLRDKDGMEWCGIRAYNHAEMAWWLNAVNGGREESATAIAWQDLPVFRSHVAAKEKK